MLAGAHLLGSEPGAPRAKQPRMQPAEVLAPGHLVLATWLPGHLTAWPEVTWSPGHHHDAGA